MSPNWPVIGHWWFLLATEHIITFLAGKNTTKHDNEASQNSFMQHGFSRCWDLLSSVTTRLLGGGRFPALCVMQAPALTMGASIVPPVWIILDNNDLDMNGGDSGVSRESGCWTWCVSPALFSSVANFSLGPDISSQHISNNLWWWNMLQWGSDGDLSQREGGWHTGTSPLQTSWYRVSPPDTGPQVWTKHSEILWIWCRGIS